MTGHAPYLVATGLTDGYTATRSANLRRAVLRARRDIDGAGVALSRADLAGTVDVDRALDGFVTLHSQREDRGELLGRMGELRRAVHAGVAAVEASSAG